MNTSTTIQNPENGVKTGKSNSDRLFLRPDEVDKLRATAKKIGRHGLRDDAIILFLYRHGLRVSELIRMEWSDIDWQTPSIYIRRNKGSTSTNHPLYPEQIKMLKSIQRTYPKSKWVFLSERGTLMTTDNVRKMIARAGKLAGLELPAHPHQLRHGCGYNLASKGVDTRALQLYLGHKDIRNTERYTALSPNRFEGFWDK